MTFNQVIGIVLVVLLVGVGAYFIGDAAPAGTTKTVSAVSTVTDLLVKTTVQNVTRTAVSSSTLTQTVNRTLSVTSTSVTTSTLTRMQVLGSGITVSDYPLYLVNLKPDSVIKFNMTITFSSDVPTYVNEVANVILFPSSGHQNDIKFIPNPVLVSSSDFQMMMVLSVYTILSHQTVPGTYMVEYAISTSQGSGLVFTVLEVAS